MAWLGNGNNPTDPTRKPLTDLNKEFKEQLVGELSEETARKTLGQFLAHNLGIMVWILTRKILEPYQRIMVKGWMQKNFSLCVAARSFGKSLIGSHFCYLYCLLNPGHKIIIVSATFRSSRQIVERIEEWARSKSGALLRQTIVKTPLGSLITKRSDLVRITFANGSEVTAVPLGDPDNLRGFRCNVLMIDEGLLISQSTINMVLKPFLAGGADATKKQLIRRRERKRIAEGKMTEAEQVKFKPDSKMIVLSSASYKWEELYEAMYKPYRAIIEGYEAQDGKQGPKAEETETGTSTYLVQQFSYKAGNPDLMDKGILDEIREKRLPESVIKREYEAQFIDESGGFFSAREMALCTIPMGQRPCVEIVGEKGFEYILGIDPNVGADPAGDHFAMCVLKILPHPDKRRKIGLVVHQYACAGAKLEHHIAYLYYVMHRFNIVYVICDCTQGKNMDFINVCNESEYFKSRKMELNPIEAEFGLDGFDEIVKDAKRSYNVSGAVRRIVQKQHFSPNVIKAGNDNLRACFDQRLVQFASHAQSVPGAVSEMCQHDIMNIHASHPEFHDEELEGSASIGQFVANQDVLIEVVKKECALIEVTSSPLGHLSFDLPHHMTRSRKDIRRIRKDGYTALWLSAWAMKIYIAIQEMPDQESDDTFAPQWIAWR